MTFNTQIPTRFRRKYGDLSWGAYDYAVTPTQLTTVTAVHSVLKDLPNYFCSQNVFDGTIIIGAEQKSMDIKRDGRVYPNRTSECF